MKRVFDVAFSAAGFFCLLPILAVIALLVRAEDGGPALFRQRRVGRDGKPFEIFKFRTMRRASGAIITVSGDPRITRVGRWVRRWKLDELPQLWNVLRGEMSLVGPRPEIPEYVRLYPPEAREILRIRPGITGPSQLDGFDEEEELRHAADPEIYYREIILPRKLRTDLLYARCHGFGTDLRILWGTAERVLGAWRPSRSRPSFGPHLDGGSR